MINGISNEDIVVETLHEDVEVTRGAEIRELNGAMEIPSMAFQERLSQAILYIRGAFRGVPDALCLGVKIHYAEDVLCTVLFA